MRHASVSAVALRYFSAYSVKDNHGSFAEHSITNSLYLNMLLWDTNSSGWLKESCKQIFTLHFTSQNFMTLLSVQHVYTNLVDVFEETEDDTGFFLRKYRGKIQASVTLIFFATHC